MARPSAVSGRAAPRAAGRYCFLPAVHFGGVAESEELSL